MSQPTHHRTNGGIPITFFLNLLLLVAASSLIGIGAAILSDESKGIDRFTNVSLGAFALTMGIFTVLMILFGVYTETEESGVWFWRIIIFILLIVLGSLALTAVSNNDGDVYHAVKKVFEDYIQNQPSNDKKLIVDTIQQDFKCCGVNGPQYWISSGFQEYPSSCYKDMSDKNDMYKNGCVSVFQKTIIPKIMAIGCISIAWGCMEVLIIIWRFSSNTGPVMESTRLLG